jgi:hypothetical protein
LVWQPSDASTGDEALMRYGAMRLHDVLEYTHATVHLPGCLKQRSLDAVATAEAEYLPRFKLLPTREAGNTVGPVWLETATYALCVQNLFSRQ